MPEFLKKKLSKEWETLIYSAKEVWAVAQAAMQGDSDSSNTEAGEDEDDISFLGNISPYSPMEPIDSLDLFFVVDASSSFSPTPLSSNLSFLHQLPIVLI